MRLERNAVMDVPEVAGRNAARRAEHAKYVKAYSIDGYRMHGSRLENAQADIAALPMRGSLLDVGCGRGELLDFAAERGFDPVRGTETVPFLIDGKRVVFAEGHKLPFADKSFDVVICNDVIEHVLPGDDEMLCRELARVARHHILITANNAPSASHIGEELHINRRPYAEWDALFREWFGGTVTWIPTNHTHETER
jgi:SAM-dependent methyltransferase